MSHLNSRAQHSLACAQHSVHYLHLVVGVLTTGHQREGVFATYESYLDTDPVEKKSVLEEEVDVHPPHHLDDSTLGYAPSSFNHTCIATIHGRGIHVSGCVLVPQLACELSILRLVAVTQDGIDVGAKRVSIRRRRHERVVEIHVHLSEERMEPVIPRCHRCIGGEVGADSSNHLSSNEQICVPGITNSMGPPPSRETSKVGLLPSYRLLYSSASVIAARP